MPTGSHSRKDLFVNVALSVAALLATLLVVEVVLRFAYWRLDDHQTLAELPPAATATENDSASGDPPFLYRYQQIRLSDDPRIIFEMRPDLRFTGSANSVHTINSAGFRGREIPVEKKPGTVRIVGLGDSVMYGEGVSDDDIFLRFLEARLAVEYPQVAWEIVNTAVGGYNTVIEVETLEEKGLAYAPDIVLMNFVGNDLDLPAFVRDRVEPFARRWFLRDFVSGHLERVRHGRLVSIFRLDEEELGWYENPQTAPARYHDMVGEEAYFEAMRRLAALRDEHGFELLVSAKANRKYTRAACRELAIPLVSLAPAIDAYLEERGIEEWMGSELTVSDIDPHPTAIAHGLYADAIFDYMEGSGMIDRVIARASEPTR